MSYSPAQVQHAIAALGHFVIQCNNNYSMLHKGQCLWRRQRGADGARAPPRGVGRNLRKGGAELVCARNYLARSAEIFWGPEATPPN